MKKEKILDLSLNNTELYKGCQIETVAGRKNLITPVSDAIELIGENLSKMSFDSERVVLTGPMAVWSYMVAFHHVCHVTREVIYRDTKSEYLIARHG